mgnify:CR=1 FL=1
MVQKFSVENTNFEPVKVVNPFIATDERGAFVKDYSRKQLMEMGIEHELKEVFYTYSKKGVIRALHFQLNTAKISQSCKGFCI